MNTFDTYTQVKREDNLANDLALTVCLGRSEIMSPSCFAHECLSPFLSASLGLSEFRYFDDYKLSSTDEMSRYQLFHLEDSLDFAWISKIINEQDFIGKHLFIYLHDTSFFEIDFSLFDKLNTTSSSISILSPWDHFSNLLSSRNVVSQLYSFPYPWIPDCVIENIDSRSSELSNSLIDSIDDPILVFARGVSEGRFHKVLSVLKSLDLLSRAVVLTEKNRFSEVSKALWFQHADEVLIYEPSSLLDVKRLIDRSACLLNPSFSSFRAQSHFLMEAFHSKTPVIVSDYGSSRALPLEVRRYELGFKEEDNLRKELQDVLAQSGVSSNERSLYEYSLSYGDPECLANELLGIVNSHH